jgi:hypothetical protein
LPRLRGADRPAGQKSPALVLPEVQESAIQLLSQALTPAAKLVRIEYTRRDTAGVQIDSDTVEREAGLALVARLSRSRPHLHYWL